MACKPDRNQRGGLRFWLHWHGEEWTEGTKLKDTPQNWERLAARAVLITEEMEAGTFDPRKRFPGGNWVRRHGGNLEPEAPISAPSTVRLFNAEWLKTKKPPLVRKSL